MTMIIIPMSFFPRQAHLPFSLCLELFAAIAFFATFHRTSLAISAAASSAAFADTNKPSHRKKKCNCEYCYDNS